MMLIEEVEAYTCAECGNRYTGKRSVHLNTSCPSRPHPPGRGSPKARVPSPGSKRRAFVPVEGITNDVTSSQIIGILMAAARVAVGSFGSGYFETVDVRRALVIDGDFRSRSIASYVAQALDRLCDNGELECIKKNPKRPKKFKVREKKQG